MDTTVKASSEGLKDKAWGPGDCYSGGEMNAG